MSYPGSWVKFLCWLIFGVHSTQHCHSGLIKTPVILSKRRWQVTPKHAYTLYPMNLEGADHAVLAVWEPITEENEFTRNLSGNIWPQLSQLAEPLWTDPGLRNGIGECKLICTGGGWWELIVERFLKILTCEEKAINQKPPQLFQRQYEGHFWETWWSTCGLSLGCR